MTQHRPAGVLFDAGGTLVQVHTARLARELHARGHAPTDLDSAFWRTLVLLDADFGPGAGEFEGWFPDWLARFADGAGVPAEVLREAWYAADAVHHLWDEPIAGAREALDALAGAGVRVGVVSNADGRVASALARAGLADCLEVVVDSTAVGVAKPDPSIFEFALQPLGLRAAQTWYVGDSVVYDAAAADAAGLTSWIVDHRGLHTRAHPRRVGSLAEVVEAALG